MPSGMTGLNWRFPMSDQLKLALGFLGIILIDLCVIHAMYVHGNMHLIKTLQAAVGAWS